jgi:hypothetical protein
MERFYSLVPFPEHAAPDLAIEGVISRRKNLLNIDYVLSGQLEKILLPDLSTAPGRKDALWKTTCLEFFLAVRDHAEYWEFNVSPSGDWNAYHMDSYRRVGFREEVRIQHLQAETHQENDAFVMNVSLDLSSVIQVEQIAQVGIAAIIHTRERQETYWALTHPASRADFHLRESFILALAG